MLPPEDLGSVLPKSQEMEPAGPLPHHPPLTTMVPLTDGAQGVETASLHSPSLGTEIPRWLSWDHPREGFSGLTMGQLPLLWAATRGIRH